MSGIFLATSPDDGTFTILKKTLRVTIFQGASDQKKGVSPFFKNSSDPKGSAELLPFSPEVLVVPVWFPESEDKSNFHHRDLQEKEKPS